MLKIMLCDDNKDDLRLLEGLLGEYRNLHVEIPMEIKALNSPVKLIEQVKRGEYHDIYILDIVMPEYDGIHVGHILREHVGECTIIYATSSPAYTLHAFRIYAGGYLLKPLSREELFECMDYVVGTHGHKAEIVYGIRTKDGIVNTDISRIVKVENISRILRFYLKGGRVIESVYIRKSFEVQLEGLLSNIRFIQPHKSFMINMDCVEKMTFKDFWMVDGSVVPISRTKLSETKRKYLEYLSNAE